MKVNLTQTLPKPLNCPVNEFNFFRMIVLLLLSSAFIGTLTNGFRFYQNNEANLECPISTAKPNLDVDRVSIYLGVKPW